MQQAYPQNENNYNRNGFCYDMLPLVVRRSVIWATFLHIFYKQMFCREKLVDARTCVYSASVTCVAVANWDEISFEPITIVSTKAQSRRIVVSW